MKHLADRPIPGAWRTIALLWFVACFNFMARTMIATMHGPLVTAIPMTEAQFGLLSSIFLWIYGLLGPVAGFLSDRYSRSRVIAICLLAWSAITWLTAYARTFEQLLVMRALMAVSEASYLPAALALISEYHRTSTRSLATGLHMTGVMCGYALAGSGGWLSERHGWTYAFRLVGIAGIIYGLLLVFVLRDAPRERESSGAEAAGKVRFGQALVSLFSRGSFILVLPFCALVGAVGWAVVGWMPTYLKEHFHLGAGAAGFDATGYMNMAGLIGLLVGGVWADRWNRTHIRGGIYVTIIGLLLAAPGLLLTSHTNFLAFALLGLVLFGFGNEFSDSTMMPILCQVTDRRYRATAYGTLNLVSCVTAGFSVFAAGVLRDRRVETGEILAFAAAALVVCAVLLLLVRPRQPVLAAASSPRS
jgi:MFS family permease